MLTVRREQLLVEPGFNPRKSIDSPELAGLAQSIKHRGLLQPLRVMAGPREDTYIIVAGHRRLLAIDALGDAAPKGIDIVIETDPQKDVRIDALVENIQRVDVNPVEEAFAFKALLEAGYTQKGVAEQMGVAAKRVTDRLAITRLPAEAIAFIREGKLPTSAVPALTKLAKAQHELAVVAAMRSAGKPSIIEELRKQPEAIVARLADDATEPRWFRIGGRWDVDKLRELGAKHERAMLLADALEGFEYLSWDEAWLGLTQERADQLAASGLLFTVDKSSDGQPIYVTLEPEAFLEALGERLPDLAEADVKAKEVAAERALQRERRSPVDAEDAPAEAPSEAAEQEARRAEREADLKQREESRTANLKIGRAILTEGAKRPVTDAAMRLIVAHTLAFMDTGRQFQAGLRLCLEQFQSQTPGKDGKAPKVTYTGGTKIEARVAATDWVLAGANAEELCGRMLSLLLAAEYADQRAMPESQRATGQLLVGPDGYDLLAALAEAVLPGVIVSGHDGPRSSLYNLAGQYHREKDYTGAPLDAYGRSQDPEPAEPADDTKGEPDPEGAES